MEDDTLQHIAINSNCSDNDGGSEQASKQRTAAVSGWRDAYVNVCEVPAQ
jgi:hypothetical protein